MLNKILKIEIEKLKYVGDFFWRQDHAMPHISCNCILEMKIIHTVNFYAKVIAHKLDFESSHKEG